MLYSQSPSAGDNAVARITRRFIGCFLLWLLCAVLTYCTAAFFVPGSPDIVYRLSTCQTPRNPLELARLVTGWTAGLAGQLFFVFLGTTSHFPLLWNGAVAVWRGGMMGCLLWLFTHASVSLGNAAGGPLFLSVYFALSVLLLFYGALERRSSLLCRLPGFLLVSGIAFCLYVAPLFSAVIFL